MTQTSQTSLSKAVRFRRAHLGFCARIVSYGEGASWTSFGKLKIV